MCAPGNPICAWVVGPPITVIGHVEGDLNKLERDGGQPAVSFSQTSSAKIDSVNHMSVRLREGMAKVKFVGGKRQFQITDLAPGELWISAGEQRQTLQLAGPTTEITIDLDREQPTAASRHVVLRFVGADKGLSPSGQIWFSATSPEPVQSGHCAAPATPRSQRARSSSTRQRRGRPITGWKT